MGERASDMKREGDTFSLVSEGEILVTWRRERERCGERERERVRERETEMSVVG